MTVLVTGGAGYIGSHMVHALVDAGERVVVLDNLTTGFDLAVAPGASLVVGDAGDQSCVAALIAEHGVDAVIHFAASIVVPDSVRDPLGYYRNNTVNSRALIETAVKEGVRHFIFSSTAAVYGNPASVPVREDDPTMPTSPYGSSKLRTRSYTPASSSRRTNGIIAKIAGIKLCEAYRLPYGGDFMSVRPTNLYGPGDNYHPNRGMWSLA